MSTHPQLQEQAAQLLHQGRSLLGTGHHSDALVIAERLLDQYELTAEMLHFACDVHFTRGNYIGSEKIATQCTQQFPDDIGGPVLRCRSLQALGRMEEARELALAIAENEIEIDSYVSILVTVLCGCMVPEAAYPLCRQSVLRDPENPVTHRRLALTCRLIGKLDEALESANIALRHYPHDYEMIGLRSSIRKATVEKNNIDQLEALLIEGCRDALGATRVNYALAKECEEIGDFERSFRFLEAGARLKRQSFPYKVSDDLRTFENLRALFGADALAQAGAGFGTDEPIFILGLPRTGSTLIERIVSNHSAVHAAGELNHFSTAMMEEVRKLGPLVDREDLVKKSIQTDMRAIGSRYIDLTRPMAHGKPHFIDKLPLNFLSLGVISCALPGAKIIHVRRTPLDACYAIYKFLFNQAYCWSYDLNETAQFYIGYRTLMDHWRTVLPGRIIDVTYERFVEDLETETRRLIGKLGLEWEDACLDFHLNSAATMTGSAAQVRQKIYSSSVGRWRSFEKQLGPLAAALEAAGIDPEKP